MINYTGKLLRITPFTASGTWSKKDDVGFVVVEVVGGGGGVGATAGSANGGNSSFGSHCQGNGGTNGYSSGGNSIAGSGGAASSGDLNISGQDGVPWSGLSTPPGGCTALGCIGAGSRGSNSGGGGGGGYSKKYIHHSSLGSTETVTVGAVGSGNQNGKAGVVLVYEYAK